jgi:hypothetical protein
MKTFLFDVKGTLVDNPAVKEEDLKKVLLVLKAAGHRIIIWSASVTLIPEQFAALADECWSKGDLDASASIDKDFILFDDESLLLASIAGNTGCRTVHAAQMGDWLVNEVWKVEKDDPTTNMSLPATREQQAVRVRAAYKKLNTVKARAVLKQHLKGRDKIAQIRRLFPMHKMYQVRALALHDLTYAGAVGFIMSYLENSNVTFSVFYDRPGHTYTPVSARAELEPEWLEVVTPEEFDALVKKDNPIVLLS